MDQSATDEWRGHSSYMCEQTVCSHRATEQYQQLLNMTFLWSVTSLYVFTFSNSKRINKISQSHNQNKSGTFLWPKMDAMLLSLHLTEVAGIIANKDYRNKHRVEIKLLASKTADHT